MAKSRPGKYDTVLPGLPVLPPEDPKRQDKINQIKEKIGYDALTLAQGYVKLRAEKDELAAELSDVQLSIDAYEQALAESQEAQGAGWGDYGAKDNMLRLATGESVRVQPEPCGQVKDKEAFRLWCIAAGYERQLQLWPSTMQSIVKERLLAGEPEPDGVEWFRRNKIFLAKNGVE